jgi:hypothetical protein
MAKRPYKHDISIGKDTWIAFGDLAKCQGDPIEIDEQLSPVMPLFESLEIECVADCCGIDAFKLWPEEIAKAVAQCDPRELESLSSKIASVQTEISRLPSDIVVSRRLNQLFRKIVFLELLTPIRKAVGEVAFR